MTTENQLPEMLAEMNEAGTLRHLSEDFLPTVFKGFLESQTAGTLAGHIRAEMFEDYRQLVSLLNELR